MTIPDRAISSHMAVGSGRLTRPPLRDSRNRSGKQEKDRQPFTGGCKNVGAIHSDIVQSRGAGERARGFVKILHSLSSVRTHSSIPYGKLAGRQHQGICRVEGQSASWCQYSWGLMLPKISLLLTSLRRMPGTVSAALFVSLLLTTASFAQQIYKPAADPKAVVVEGQARFTVLTPEMIRMEWSADSKFEDRPSFVALNRELPVPRFKQSTEGQDLVLKTSALE